LIAGYLNWRWGFALAAVLGAPVALYGVRRPAPAPIPRIHLEEIKQGSGGMPLYVVAAAGACAAAGGNILGAFYVESVATRGFDVTTAGMLLVLGSVCGILGRLLWGWLADRRLHDPLNSMGILLVFGIFGFLLIGLTTSLSTLLFGTLLAFGAGWAWKGLYNLAVVRENSDSVSIALGVSQMGVFAGSVAGPLGFGVVLEQTNYEIAWTATAVVMAAAAVLTYAAKWANEKRR
jgi:predicted MFS family arabinose efflux permease